MESGYEVVEVVGVESSVLCCFPDLHDCSSSCIAALLMVHTVKDTLSQEECCWLLGPTLKRGLRRAG